MSWFQCCLSFNQVEFTIIQAGKKFWLYLLRGQLKFPNRSQLVLINVSTSSMLQKNDIQNIRCLDQKVDSRPHHTQIHAVNKPFFNLERDPPIYHVGYQVGVVIMHPEPDYLERSVCDVMSDGETRTTATFHWDLMSPPNILYWLSKTTTGTCLLKIEFTLRVWTTSTFGLVQDLGAVISILLIIPEDILGNCLCKPHCMYKF